MAGRLAAEKQWLGLRTASGGRLKTHVFRLAGIYGPKRSALDTVAREAAVSPESVVRGRADRESDATLLTGRPLGGTRAVPQYVSRVHVDDIAATLLASMAGEPSRVQDASRAIL